MGTDGAIPHAARERQAVRRDPTIIDVARLSGVSKSTVSNVIHGSAPVAAQTRARVEAAIEQLHYRPNGLARDLKRRHAATAGVLVGDLSNPFYAELTKLIERRIAGAGYVAIICDTDSDPAVERERIELLLEQRVAGVLLTYFGGDERTLQSVQRAGVPIVGVSVIDRRFDSVASDDAAGARLAARHLAELGHRRIAYVRSPGTEAPTNRARLRGLRDVARAMGLTPGPVVTLDHPARGAVLLSDVLAAREPPTAYVAGNDVTALALIEQLESCGVPVPQAASVVGFDDIPLASYHRIALTTLRQPATELADRAVERLLQRIGTAGEPPQRLQERLQPTLITRGTTAPPPAR
ncbi:MAG TPA: LacI family DNA-binding transcriptional regulator [Solirubrobacteraceae bacterium]|nr:LacI family DNA-binding transcriptional regulator [Solirubrobacteraceae bacterium]